MQKIYSFIFVALMCILHPAMTSAVTIKYDIDDASRINFAINGNPYEVVSGINTFEVQLYVNVEITARRNCSLVSVTADLDEVEPIREGRWFNIVRKDQDNVVFTVKTADLDTERNEKFTITVNGDPEMVGATFEGTNTPLFLREGSQTISYSQALEPELILTSLSDKVPLYKVTLDGKVLDGDWSYRVALADGCNIVVDQAFPDRDVTLTITYSEGAEGCVDTFTLNGGDSRHLEDNKIVCRGGDNLIIYIKDTYKLLGIGIDGAPQPITPPGTYFYHTVKDDATINIDARRYGDVMFMVDIDDAAAVSLYRGYLNPDYLISLTDGLNHAGVPELDPRLRVKPNKGYYIKSINGNTSADYTQPLEISITEGMTIEIRTGRIIADRQAVLYVDNAAVAEYYFDVQNVFDDEYTFNKNGYTVLDFGKQDNPLEVAWSAPTMNGALYLNDQLQTSPYAAHTYPLDLEEGDVVKVFLEGTPAVRTVTFDIEDGCTTEILRDVIVPVTAKTLSCFDGTVITVEADGAEVWINGLKAAAGDDGMWQLTVAADTAVEVKTPAGVAGIEADAAEADATVYNLHGIALGNSTAGLPAGIYVRGGHKIVVR